VSVYEQSAGADVGHVSSDARGTAAAVGQLKFNLRLNGSTLKPSSFELRGTSHMAPSARCFCRGVKNIALAKGESTSGPWLLTALHVTRGGLSDR
jgi:hypothetical protein